MTPKLYVSDLTEKAPSIAYSGDMKPLHKKLALSINKLKEWKKQNKKHIKQHGLLTMSQQLD